MPEETVEIRLSGPEVSTLQSCGFPIAAFPHSYIPDEDGWVVSGSPSLQGTLDDVFAQYGKKVAANV